MSQPGVPGTQKGKRKTADSAMAAQYLQVARGKLGKSGADNRPKRVKRFNERDVDALRYFAGPRYEAATDHLWAGGKHSSATLGPGCLLSANSDADPDLPRAIAKAREEYPGLSFKAGHLLNAELGGDGKDAANITILTATANSSHRAFDNPIKKAVAELRKAYVAMGRLGIDVTTLNYGIQVDIEIDDDRWGDDFPDNCIAEGLNCTAGVSNEPDVDNLLGTKFPDEADRPTRWRANLAAANAAIAKVSEFVDEAETAGAIRNQQPA